MYTAAPGAVLMELTLRDVISNLPHDAGAIVVLVMLAGFVYMIWYGSRKSTVDRFSSPSSAKGEPSETGVRQPDAVAAHPDR